MKSNYVSLWLLLAVGFAVVTALSAASPLTIGGYELRDSGLVSALTARRPAPAAALSDTGAVAVANEIIETSADCEAIPVDSSAHTLLFIGDSMLEGLSPRLAAYAHHNGHRLYSVIWYSSTSEVWGRSGKLKHYISTIKPDFIFISLGANELFVKDIATRRDKYVKKILDDVGDIHYLWIGPPNWRKDTGINDLVAANARPGHFFLSDGMTFERSEDGAHPTRSSAIEWMDSVVRWMQANHPHRFLLDIPEAETARARRVFIHQPDER